MGKKTERRSEKDRRDKSNKRAEHFINFFISEKDEKRKDGDRRKSKKS